MYKLVAIDLDGSLLNSEKGVSEENKKAIRYATEKGVKIVVCSGRIYKGARIYAKLIGIKGPVISCNGAFIKDMSNDEVIYNNFLNKNDCIKIIEMCHQEGVYFHVYFDDIMYSEIRECPSPTYLKGYEEFPEEDRVEVRVVDNVLDVAKNSPVSAPKVVVINDNMNILKKIRSQVEQLGTVDVVSSFFDNFEVMNKGVDKGKALSCLAQKLGINREEIIAIGDNENDKAMIEYAGLGIAMGNAEKEIKDIAGFITGTNDDNGVAQAIERFI